MARDALSAVMPPEPIPFKQIIDGYKVGERLFFRLDGLSFLLALIDSDGPLASVDLYSTAQKPTNLDREKCRQKVRRSIMAAIVKLIECEQTRHIGEHLQNNVTTGNYCDYSGDWDWDL